MIRRITKLPAQLNIEVQGSTLADFSGNFFLIFEIKLFCFGVSICDIRPEFFIFCFTDFFRSKLVSEDGNKNKNKIHSDHFPIELKFLRF